MPEPAAAVEHAWTKALLATLFTCLIYAILFFSNSNGVGDIFLYLLLVVSGLVAFVFLGQASVISISTKQRPSYALLLGLAAAIAVTYLAELYSQGRFYGKEVLNATFKDDLSYLDLQLFADGHYRITSAGLLGTDIFTGTYTKTATTITFDRFPVIDNDFVAQTIHIKGSHLYFRGTSQDSSYYHFTINQP